MPGVVSELEEVKRIGDRLAGIVGLGILGYKVFKDSFFSQI